MLSPKPLMPWAILRDDYISAGIPLQHPILDDPKLSLLFESSPDRLGLRLAVDRGRNVSMPRDLRNITFRKVSIAGLPHVEVLTDSRELFRAVYALIGDVVSRLADGEADALRAVQSSLVDFDLLLSKSKALSRESAIGLYGEMIVLEALIAHGQAVDCWVGSARQVHDFRLGSVDLEVKTTTANTRLHAIHGLNQLTPGPNRDLLVISIRIAAGAAQSGRSLDDVVRDISSLIAADVLAQRDLERRLLDAGYESGTDECRVAYQVVGQPVAIAIGRDFPALDYSWLADSLGTEPSARILNLSFYLNLEGLGSPIDGESFDAWT